MDNFRINFKACWLNRAALFSLFVLASCCGKVMAATTVYVPIAVDDITIFVPTLQSQCTPQDLCISWISPTYTAIAQTAFAGDSAFNTNLDSNKNHQLSTVSLYSDKTDPLTLQCQDSRGNWAAVSASGVSATSTIGARAGDGSPQNLNAASAPSPVYEHRWPGSLLVGSSNCLINTVILNTVVTDQWTYTHYRKSATLRAIRADGSAFYVMPPSQESCRTSDGSTNLWQRTANCNGSTNSFAFNSAYDEPITRITNYGTFSISLNSGRDDAWTCDYLVSLDNQPINVVNGVQKVLGRDTTNSYSQSAKKGAHVLSFTPPTGAGFCYPTSEYANGFCPIISGCTDNTTVVNWSPSGKATNGHSTSFSVNMTVQ